MAAPAGGGMMGGGMMGAQAPGHGGGSFLATAAATVAGVVGGAMLLNGIRSMMGGHQSFAGDNDRTSPSHASSPWDSDRGGSGDLSATPVSTTSADSGAPPMTVPAAAAAFRRHRRRSAEAQPDDTDVADFDGGGDSDTSVIA